jgi:hypothetical protein
MGEIADTVDKARAWDAASASWKKGHAAGVQEFVEFAGEQLAEMDITPHRRELGKSLIVTLIRSWNARNRTPTP